MWNAIIAAAVGLTVLGVNGWQAGWKVRERAVLRDFAAIAKDLPVDHEGRDLLLAEVTRRSRAMLEATQVLEWARARYWWRSISVITATLIAVLATLWAANWTGNEPTSGDLNVRWELPVVVLGIALVASVVATIVWRIPLRRERRQFRTSLESLTFEDLAKSQSESLKNTAKRFSEAEVARKTRED